METQAVKTRTLPNYTWTAELLARIILRVLLIGIS
jgi:hypothetical protein